MPYFLFGWGGGVQGLGEGWVVEMFQLKIMQSSLVSKGYVHTSLFDSTGYEQLYTRSEKKCNYNLYFQKYQTTGPASRSRQPNQPPLMMEDLFESESATCNTKYAFKLFGGSSSSNI